MKEQKINRRLFLQAGAVGGASILWPGCSSPAPGNPDATVLPCGILTEPNIEGPFFTSNSPQRTDLTEPGQVGTALRISGRVLGTDCAPIAGALLDFWQADDAGDYDNVGFLLRGHQYADQDGAFLVDAIIPGHYLNGATFRPAHVHVKVRAPGFPLLTTQLYFAGDEFNAADPFIRDSLIMDLADGPGGRKDAIFDFILTPS